METHVIRWEMYRVFECHVWINKQIEFLKGQRHTVPMPQHNVHQSDTSDRVSGHPAHQPKMVGTTPNWYSEYHPQEVSRIGPTAIARQHKGSVTPAQQVL